MASRARSGGGARRQPTTSARTGTAARPLTPSPAPAGGRRRCRRRPRARPRPGSCPGRSPGAEQLLLAGVSMRGDDRDGGQALHAAEGGGARHEPHGVVHAGHRLEPAPDAEGEHPAAPAELAQGERVVGVRLEHRVGHPGDLGVALEGAGHAECRLVLPLHANLERLHAADEVVGGGGVEGAAGRLPNRRHGLHERPAAGDGPPEVVAVAVQVLGGAVHDQVDAQLQRPQVHGGREGGVEDREDAPPAAGRGHRRHVDHAQRGIGGGLEVERAGVPGRRGHGPGEALEGDGAHLDAEAGQDVAREPGGLAVDGVAEQQRVPGAQDGEVGRGDGRHAAREAEGRLGALQRGDLRSAAMTVGFSRRRVEPAPLRLLQVGAASAASGKR